MVFNIDETANGAGHRLVGRGLGPHFFVGQYDYVISPATPLRAQLQMLVHCRIPARLVCAYLLKYLGRYFVLTAITYADLCT